MAKVVFASLTCVDCGETRIVHFLDSAPAKRCRSCANKINPATLRKGQKREQSIAWKGGRRPTGDGYIYVYVDSASPYFKMGVHGERIREHRLIMAQSLSRCLEPWEVVHHINGNKIDNRLENLELLPNDTNHLPFTFMQKRIEQLEQELNKYKEAFGEL